VVLRPSKLFSVFHEPFEQHKMCKSLKIGNHRNRN
jgi:hypothetical protein